MGEGAGVSAALALIFQYGHLLPKDAYDELRQEVATLEAVVVAAKKYPFPGHELDTALRALRPQDSPAPQEKDSRDG